MDLSEKIHRHLPLYLNAEDRAHLFDEIRSFPENIDSRIYSSHPEISDQIIYQGDIIKDQPLIFLPDKTIREKRVFVISNTCDIDLTNNRAMTPKIVYCPTISFEAYSRIASSYYDSKDKLENHLRAIRKQRITSMFYLPKHGQLHESIVLFDSPNNYRLDAKHLKSMLANRIITLGNYGFMLFLVKLSIHFTRIEENVNRG